MRTNKYGAKRTEYNGRVYHSAAEARRAAELDLLVLAGEVREWRPQVEIPLHAPAHHGDDGRIGKYIADFKVEYVDGRVEVEDVKGVMTPLSKWKIKHAEAEYGIKVKIVK